MKQKEIKKIKDILERLQNEYRHDTVDIFIEELKLKLKIK